MNTDGLSPQNPLPEQKPCGLQFSLLRMFVATTAVAAIVGLATWGGWVKSDAVVYLSIVVVAAVFSAAARRAIFGACTILGMFWLAAVFGETVFGSHGRMSVNPLSFWIFAAFLTVSAAVLRSYTKATIFSLAMSLVLAEIFTAVVILYTYGYPTLFQAFSSEHRIYVLQHLRGNFPVVEQWLIVLPWLAGIVFGEIIMRRR